MSVKFSCPRSTNAEMAFDKHQYGANGANIKFCNWLVESLKGTLHMLQQVYGERAIGIFKERRFKSVSKVDEAARL